MRTHSEERYAMKLCLKLGKNASETYEMLQTAFRSSCTNRAWVFEWHKRFNEGRESVKDNERCGRSKEVRTPEVIGQIKNFMDKDRRVSIVTISAQFDVNVGTVLDALVTCDESMIYCYDRDQETEFSVEACWLSQTQEGQTEQIHPQTFDDLFF